jgi:hypothetical protein
MAGHIAASLATTGAGATCVKVAKGNVAIAAGIVPNARTSSFHVISAIERFNIELIVAVYLVHDSSADTEDLQHASSCASEDDDCEHNDDKNRGAKCEGIIPRK